ncbi:MAG: response regulator transcription factor [Halopseudomonas sp.]
MVTTDKEAHPALPPRQVLVIEDDPDIAALISMHLSDNGFKVQLENRGDTGLDAYSNGSFDLVVLDLMLPGLDGLTLCREMRAGDRYIPILMLTAKSTELDRVLGLEMGADDYLTKPFSLPELVARVKALLRRVAALSAPQTKPLSTPIIENDGLTIDAEKRLVLVHGKTVELTAREFDLLLHLASHPGRVYNRIQLLDQVWGYSYEGYEHTVNTHINRLRAKIEIDPAKPLYVQTIWGVGYKFAT